MIPQTWFTVVEIEVNSHCNRKCCYCPNSSITNPSVPRYMSDQVFRKIIGELKRIGFSGRLSYHFYNEPLLRSDLENLVRYVSEKLPNAYQLLFTNGDFLSDSRYLQLKKAGISHFFVTRHDFQNIKERKDQIVVTPKDLILTNRGGNLYKLKEPLKYPCYAPSEILIITVTGDVLFCFEDARRTNVMGNIVQKPLKDIWFSSEFNRLRKVLNKGDRLNSLSICKNCNNLDYINSGNSWYPKIDIN